MKTFNTEVSIVVNADIEYQYKVMSSDDVIELQYNQFDGKETSISFGTHEELEAVANAMLQIVQFAKQVKV